jgi:hypothetical protein
LRTRSLTTIRQPWPSRTEISSLPSARGPGRADTVKLGPQVLRLRFLTVSQSSLGSLTQVWDRCLPAAANAKRLVNCGLSAIKSSRSHGAAAAACDASHFEFQTIRNPALGTSRTCRTLPVVPDRLDPAATIANRFFECRSRRTIRAFGSPNTPRTVALARKPTNNIHPRDAAVASPIRAPLSEPKSSGPQSLRRPLSTGFPPASKPPTRDFGWESSACSSAPPCLPASNHNFSCDVADGPRFITFRPPSPQQLRPQVPIALHRKPPGVPPMS